MRKYTLQELYEKGLISGKVINYKEMQNKVAQYVSTGMKKSDAVKQTAEVARVSVQTIYNALKVKF